MTMLQGCLQSCAPHNGSKTNVSRLGWGAPTSLSSKVPWHSDSLTLCVLFLSELWVAPGSTRVSVQAGITHWQVICIPQSHHSPPPRDGFTALLCVSRGKSCQPLQLPSSFCPLPPFAIFPHFKRLWGWMSSKRIHIIKYGMMPPEQTME